MWRTDTVVQHQSQLERQLSRGAASAVWFYLACVPVFFLSSLAVGLSGIGDTEPRGASHHQELVYAALGLVVVLIGLGIVWSQTEPPKPAVQWLGLLLGGFAATVGIYVAFSESPKTNAAGLLILLVPFAPIVAAASSGFRQGSARIASVLTAAAACAVIIAVLHNVWPG